MIEDLVRPHLKHFRPYTSARSEVPQAQVLLDANELPYNNPACFDGISLNRYPDPLQLELRKRLAEVRGVSSDLVFAGVGSDEIIDLLIRLFCEPGKNSIAVLEPTYGVYRVAAALNDVRVIPIELDSQFQIDTRKVLSEIDLSTKILFLCSPNNPTGNLLNRDDILLLCRELNALVVVDEAYMEFAESADSMTNEVASCDNLVILRTLSKAWGLAGIRLGYCIADAAVVSYLLRIKAPYNVNAATARIALQALQKTEFLTNAVRTNKIERERLIAGLEGLPHVSQVYPSDANFVLVEFDNPISVYELLAAKGIIVRRRSEPRLKNCLRITVGTAKENDLLISTLAGQP